MSKNWQVLFNAENAEWVAYEISGLLSNGECKSFGENGKQEAIEYAKAMAGSGKVYINHSEDDVALQWQKANADATRSPGCYPFNQPGWIEQSQQNKF